MRVALDTNVLVYAEGLNDTTRRDAALALLARLSPHTVILPLQVVGELTRILVRRSGRPPAEIAVRIDLLRASAVLVPTSAAVFDGALELVTRHRFDVWDAVILSAASECAAEILLSEDLQAGFRRRGTTVLDPFGSVVPGLLAPP